MATQTQASLVASLEIELGQLLTAHRKACEAEEYQVGHGVEARRLRRSSIAELTAAIAAKRAEIAALTRSRRVLYFR